MALCATLVIVLFLKNELSFDNFHPKSDRIYRFTVTDPAQFEGKHFARVFNPQYVPQMAEYFPEIENYVRLVPVLGGVVKLNERFISVDQAFQTDSTFFDIFNPGLLVGNPAHILDNPGSMVVSETFAKKVFGDLDPLGQVVTLPDGQYYNTSVDFVINGIMRDFPPNSHFHPEFIVSTQDKGELDRFAWTYFLLTENSSKNNILSGFKNFYSEHINQEAKERDIQAHLQNVSDIHLHSNKLREIEINSDISIVYTLSIAVIILLLIALINYANLNIGMAAYNQRYIYISKVLGSSNWMNLKYFLIEGIIITITSISFCGLLAMSANFVIQKHFSINLFVGNLMTIIGVVGIFNLLSILSGCLQPLRQMIINLTSPLDFRKNPIPGRKGISKSLIVLQYAISISLIVAVIVIHRQTSYALGRSMGVEDNNMVVFNNVHTDVQNKFEVFKAGLLRFNSIQSISAMLEPPGGEANDRFEFTMEGNSKDETGNGNNTIVVFPCDYSLPQVFNLNFLSGNDFSEKNIDSEGAGEYIINESALKLLNHINPQDIIGKEFGLISNIEGVQIPKGTIIGVVKDFHLSSIKKEIEPMVLFKQESLWLLNFVVSFKPGMQTEAMNDLENVWTEMFSEHEFQYEYVSSMYKSVYKTEILQANLLSVFTFVALFICSTGLLGMAMLAIRRRTKEIGLRKISGATIGEIVTMLYWDFIKWIVLSFLIAIPFAYLAMDKWLENFVYKTGLNWWIFPLAGAFALISALITVSIQAWKAASRNPVETLRYE